MRPHDHRTQWLLLALPIGLALVIYHPYRTLPLDIWDFREFLPILHRATGQWDRFAALIAYYAHHGRMNPLLYATFVVQYAWFGTDASGWQWLRFGWMSLDLVLIVLVARRMGLRIGAGVAAASLLVVATPAVRAWVQLMAEPQALAAILGATYVALGYSRAVHWQRSATAIAGLVALAFLSKEIVGSLGAAVLIIAVWWRCPEDAGPLLSRRNVALAVVLALVAAAEGMLLAAVRSRPEATGYGMAYGSATVSLERFDANLVAILLPVRPGVDARLGLLFPANVLTIVVLVLGLTTYLRRRPADARLAQIVALGMLPVVIGAVAYLPWPKFDTFYALPFFAGLALLYGVAIDELVEHRGVRRAFAVAAAVLIPCYGAIAASRSVETAAASLRLNADLARLVGRFAPGDTVVILSPPEGPHALPVNAMELRDYAAALHWIDTTRSAVIQSAPCGRFIPGTSTQAPHSTFVSYSFGCGELPDASLRIVSEFSWHDWLTLKAVHDTMTLDLSGGPVQRLLRRAP